MTGEALARREIQRAVLEWRAGRTEVLLRLNADVLALPPRFHDLVVGAALAVHEAPGLRPRALVERWRRAGDDDLADALDSYLPLEAQDGADEATPFPTELLPRALRAFVVGTARSLGCDAAMVALPALAACAGAIGLSRAARLKPGWSEPAILWTVVVSPSGSLKSPASDAALGPVKDRQAALLREHEEALRRHEARVQVHEKELAAWRRAAGGGDPPEPPERPAAVRLMTSDPTVESLAVLLEENPKGILLARDELAGWLGSFDRYARGQADAAAWLELHRGGMIVIDRKTADRRTIAARGAVSISGTVQPGTLRRLLGERHIENGLLPRFLLAMPAARERRWMDASLHADAQAGYESLLLRLWGLEPDRREDGSTCSVEMDLAPEALAVFRGFVDEHGAEGSGLDEALGAAFSKIEGYAARLALVLYLVRWAAGERGTDPRGPVDAASVEAACALARWFAGEARRVHAMLAEDADAGRRRRLLEWLRRRGGEATVRDLCHGLRAYRGKAELAQADLDALSREGRGSWVPVEHDGAGRPVSAFVLGPVARVTVSRIQGAARSSAIVVTVTPRDAGPPLEALDPAQAEPSLDAAGVPWGVGDGGEPGWLLPAG